jgi:hypothetical protein
MRQSYHGDRAGRSPWCRGAAVMLTVPSPGGELAVIELSELTTTLVAFVAPKFTPLPLLGDLAHLP